ncbi:MAG: HAD-IIIA family hydrolase, partial [Deltaproteobacteria bacterium]|nr:HAD-IIIA family hydrolase [Deltaproteobacteria bacterium]MBW2530698.1 HAD-IIIA family hydrolase [Deltaproteobacteria bacterium]
MARAVVVDRDGTLVDFVRDAELGVVTPAFHPEQLRLLPGVLPGLRVLHEAGYAIAVATNQPDAAKGKVPVEAIERTNQALVEQLEREGIGLVALEACLHHPTGGPGGVAELIRRCDCRKPRPGMLLSVAARL